MKIGLTGLAGSGKTTLFKLLTGTTAEAGAKLEANLGMARVPDPRIDFLTGMYHPKKTAYAQIELTDIPGLVPESTGHNFLSALRNVEALVQVVRAFQDPLVAHPVGTIDPWRDLDLLHTELLLADLEVVTNRCTRLTAGKQKPIIPGELELLQKCQTILEGEGRLESLEFAPEQNELVRGFSFLTQKPMVVVVNLDEAQWRSGDYPGKAQLEKYCRDQEMPLLTICAQTEMEIGTLAPEERAEFLADLGITESGIDRLAQAIYGHMKLISFFTVGEDEVKAWTINQGTPARRAAGKIHSDIERGFIRAEVVKYHDLHELGSMVKLKEKGLFRLEGKEYLVQDGDIINFRFNV